MCTPDARNAERNGFPLPCETISAMIKIQKIFCPIDFFPAALNAVQYAAGLAKNYGAKLHLLHVVTPIVTSARFPLNPVDSIKAMEKASVAEMDLIVAQLRARGLKVESDVRSGDVQDEIKRSIPAVKPDLIAMGTHGRRGVTRWMMGSVTEWMMRHSPAPLLTISARELKTDPVFRRILVTTDFSEGSADALAYALSIAQANHSKITLLHVIDRSAVDIPSMYRETLMAGVQEQMKALVPPGSKNRPAIATRVDEGVPYRIILRILETDKPDLVVMNIHGKSMVDRALLGSTAERVVRAALCPVMLIPPMKNARATASPRRTAKTS